MQQILNKIKGLLSIADKGGYLIIGADKLKGYKKKLYLILKSDDGSKNLIKIAENTQIVTNCELITLKKHYFSQITHIENCKILGVKNKGLADEIIKYIRSEDIV